MGFDEEAFNKFILDNEILGIKEDRIPLKSGIKSYFYANWRNITDMTRLWEITTYIKHFLDSHGLNPNAIYGVPEGATKLGILASVRNGLSQPSEDMSNAHVYMGRGKTKEHGEPINKSFLGVPTGDIVVIEDVVTTGGSLLKEIKKLRELENCNIQTVVVLTDRLDRGGDGVAFLEQKLTEEGIPYFPMSYATDLIPEAFRRFTPVSKSKEKIGRALEEEVKEYNGVELILT